MEAAVLWKAAMKPRLPTGLGKRCAFPTAPTAPAAGEKQARRTKRDTEANLQNLTYTTCGRRGPHSEARGVRPCQWAAKAFPAAAAPVTDAARFGVRSSDTRNCSSASFGLPCFSSNSA